VFPLVEDEKTSSSASHSPSHRERFGHHASHALPQVVEWVGWASTDGLSWEELSMADVFDTPCEPTEDEHCGLIKAHMLDDAIVAYAWTWPPGEEHALPKWKLLIGTVGNPD